MIKKHAHRIRRVLGIVLSISIIIAALCLICACISIYQMGDQSFSREAVADTFSQICVPIYICLGLVIISTAADLLLPREDAKAPASKIKIPVQQPQRNSKQRSSLLRNVLLLAALLFTLFGFFTGGTADVLTKAINICTECIGLG